MSPNVLVLMGVCGCGKSTIGLLLSEKLGWPLEEADDYHSEANKMKMSSGMPLTDQDRLPWLLSLKSIIDQWQITGKKGILTCSALKKSYRDLLCDRDKPMSSETSAPKMNSSSIISQNVADNDQQSITSAAADRQQMECMAAEADILGIQHDNQQYSCSRVDKDGSSVLFVYLKVSRQKLELRLNQRKGHFMPHSLLETQLQCLEEPSSDENHIVVDGDLAPDEIVNQILARIANNESSSSGTFFA